MLLPLLCALGVTGAAVTCWFLPVRNLWLIPIFAGLSVAYTAALIVFCLLLLFISSLFFPKRECPPKKNRAVFIIIREVCIAITQFLRVRVKAEGVDMVPDRPFLLLSNHRSNFDPIITIAVLRKHPMAFLTKEGNKKIPIAGPYIRMAGFLTIDRENPRNAVQTLRTTARLIQRDKVSYGIYPEGTRNRTEEPLLPFHDGVLMAARKANVPVVVVGMKNTADITHRFPLHSTEVPFRVLGVYGTDEVLSRRDSDLGAEIRDLMLSFLEENA